MIDYDGFCRMVLELDDSVRSVRMADAFGRLVGSAYRPGVAHMKEDEGELYSFQSVLRVALRENFHSTNGRLRYSMSVYEKTVRVTIPLSSAGEKLYLLLSLDSDRASTVREMLIPAIENSFSKIG